MPKPSDIITTVAGLMNDFAQTRYTNAVCLPYLNLALNDIPVTHETSSVITLRAGVNVIGLSTSPVLPSDLVEILQLWESPSGLSRWTPMNKKEFIPHYLEDNTTISQFLIWALEQGRVNLIAANSDNDLKIDYIASLFSTPILIANINVNLPFTNIETYLDYKTAALCAMFVAENETRAMALDSLAGQAINRSLGIPIKGMQSVVTRRRPFRFAYKRRGVNY